MGSSGHYVTVETGIRRYIAADGTPGAYHVTVSYRGDRAIGRADTLTEARDIRSALRERLRRGEHDPAAGRRTVGEAIARYYRSARYRELGAKEQRERKRTLGWWQEQLGPRTPVRSVRPPVVADLRDELEDSFAAGTVNRRLSHLSVALGPAIEAGWLDGNPVRAIMRPRERPPLGEILTDGEVLAWQTACEASEDRRLRYLLPCLLSTGARISEYMTTRHAEVDLSRGTSLIRRGKSGSPRVLHYHGRGLDALKEAMQVRSITGHLWASGRRGGIWPPNDVMREAKEAAEIDKPGLWHLMRRTCGTWLAYLGATDTEIREHLGHVPGSPAIARYALLGKIIRSELAVEYVKRSARAA